MTTENMQSTMKTNEKKKKKTVEKQILKGENNWVYIFSNVFDPK